MALDTVPRAAAKLSLFHQLPAAAMELLASKGCNDDGAPRRQFHGVRELPSGKWMPEVHTTDGITRIYVDGPFDTDEAAARAYDFAALKSPPRRGSHAGQSRRGTRSIRAWMLTRGGARLNQ